MTCGKLTAMLQGRAVTWVSENRPLAAGVALVVVAAAIMFAIVTGGSEDELRSKVTESSADDATVEGGEQGGPAGAGGRSSGKLGAPESGESESLIPGLSEGPQAVPCNPVKVDAPGVTDTTITIGQIITDNSSIPQQLKPVNEGLEAFVKLFNSTGGLCKRTLELEYRNDNLNPATHSQDAQELADEVLAFVGNDSLLDFLDYQREPPFEPTVRSSDGSFVPDVGGLAFSYARSQSRWHAGVVGSVSPVLVGGGQFKYLIDEAKANGKPCTKAGVVYLNEPTRASEDQANLGRVALEQSWGGNLKSGNTQLYAANLADPEPAYRVLVDRMVADGMNCVFAYTDVQSSINLVLAMTNRGYWPPDRCSGLQCFRVAWVPFTVYDQKFVRDVGDGARNVSTFIPHAPLSEVNEEAVRVYLGALEAIPGARPSSFSIFGFASGVMFVQALQACPQAPTRDCLIRSLRELQDFTAGGLLGGTTPFRTTRVTYESYGTYDWKWIFNRSILLRVLDRGGKRDFYRIRPDAGFFEDTLKVARGTPA